jgi:hypothetical protein
VYSLKPKQFLKTTGGDMSMGVLAWIIGGLYHDLLFFRVCHYGNQV